MKVLLLSAYDAESHRRWRSSLVEGFPCWDWNILHLPPRFFNWRIRGNSLTWALSESSALSQRYDCVLATSMVDLATLRGLVPSLASIPAVVYCHENQFAYPVTANQRFSIEPQMVTLYSGLCADRLVFNSSFNRETFLSGVDRLLKKMPDAVPAGVTDVLRSKSQVLPVPIENEWFEESDVRLSTSCMLSGIIAGSMTRGRNNYWPVYSNCHQTPGFAFMSSDSSFAIRQLCLQI